MLDYPDLKVMANVCIMHPLGAFAGSYKIRHLATSRQEGIIYYRNGPSRVTVAAGRLIRHLGEKSISQTQLKCEILNLIREMPI